MIWIFKFKNIVYLQMSMILMNFVKIGTQYVLQIILHTSLLISVVYLHVLLVILDILSAYFKILIN